MGGPSRVIMTGAKDPRHSTNGVFQEKSFWSVHPPINVRGTLIQFRESLVQPTNATAPHQLFNVVDEEAVGSDRHVVRFEDGAELAGFFEVEQHFSLAGCVEQDGVDLFEQRGVWVVERDLDAEGVGQLDLDVFERLNVRDGELRGGVFFTAQDTANDDGDVDLQLVFELFVVGGEGDELDLADGVFERGLGVEFAGAVGFGYLEACHDDGDLDLV